MAADFMSLRDKRSWPADLTRIVARFASLRHPGAVTGAARAFASPNAAAAVPSEMSGAFGPLIAGPHRNSYAPGWETRPCTAAAPPALLTMVPSAI